MRTKTVWIQTWPQPWALLASVEAAEVPFLTGTTRRVVQHWRHRPGMLCNACKQAAIWSFRIGGALQVPVLNSP